MMCFSHLCFMLRAASSIEDLRNADAVKSIPPAYRHRLYIQSVSCVATFIYQAKYLTAYSVTCSTSFSNAVIKYPRR
ncbi:hypothetical protein P692DRAFT_20189842 [Suillus brevipes Sb2]|nr:hypothetical protein P692DRAFT_20189842 [Suillus brevipes Sb2]